MTEEYGYDEAIRDMVKAEKEFGIDKVRQIAKFQGSLALSQVEAMQIINVLWGDAPLADKKAAAMLCSSYRLNPLAGHVFLIPFNEKDKDGNIIGMTWSRVIGIKAKRLLASRRGAFSYEDFSPRLMTEAEQIKVWGKVDPDNVCEITILKDMKTGAIAYGFGKWPKGKGIKGADKGNSRENMAGIHSESQALDRLRPGEMPSVGIIDENFAEIEEVSKIDLSTGEIIDSTATVVPQSQDTPQSQNKPVEAQASTKVPEEVKALAEKVKQKLEKAKRDPATIKTIENLARALKEDFHLSYAEQWKELNITGWNELAISPADAYRQVAAARQ